MIVKFLGHAAVYFETALIKGIIDPFITGNPSCNISVDDIESLTHIFLTHGHGDHIGDTIELAKKFNATVITNFEIANFLATEDVNVHAMHIGGRKTFDFGIVKMTPALHGSAISTPSGTINGGSPCGFVIKSQDKTLYHAGDTGLTMDMKLLTYESIDLAFLPIGGNFTMDIQDAVIAADFIKAKKIVPMHYNTFPVIQADPHTFKSLVNTSEVVIMDSGHSITL